VIDKLSEPIEKLVIDCSVHFGVDIEIKLIYHSFIVVYVQSGMSHIVGEDHESN